MDFTENGFSMSSTNYKKLLNFSKILNYGLEKMNLKEI